MKKLNSTTYKYATKVSSYSQCKVIETNDGFFLNTVYHNNKETFEPTTKQSYNSTFTSTLNDFLIVDRHIHYAYDYYSRHYIQNNCIPDLYNANVYYTFSYNQLLKYEEKDGTITELAKSYYTSTDQLFYYMGQNEDSLFFACIQTSTKYIYKILKSTLTKTSIMSYYGSNNSYIYRPTVIKETTNYIYFYHGTSQSNSTSNSSYYSPKIQISRIDKVNGTCEVVNTLETVTATSTTYIMNMVSDAVVKISDTVYGIILKYPNTTTSASDYFKLVTLDLTDEENPVITGTALPVTDFTATSANKYSYDTTYYVFNNTINGTDYLYFIRNYYNATDSGNTVSTGYFCMYTFKITKNSSNVPTGLTQVDFHEGDTIIKSNINSFIVNKDRKIIVFWTKKGLYIMKVEESTGKFILMQTLDTTAIKSFGIDQLNRIWILYTDYTVGFVGLTDFSSYIVEFEKSDYAYTGEDISTYITLRCLDVLNNRMDASFNLTIVGNATFDESKTKVLTVTTNTTDTDDKKVPITINGAGRIVVYPTLVID